MIREGLVDLSITQVYAPTTDYEEEVGRFYEKLEGARFQCKENEINSVIGDFSARVGRGSEHEVVVGMGPGREK